MNEDQGNMRFSENMRFPEVEACWPYFFLAPFLTYTSYSMSLRVLLYKLNYI